MRGGRATDYLRIYPDADRMNIVGFIHLLYEMELNRFSSQVAGIASGLAHLHDHALIHGEVMGGNVLIEHSSGRAMLCDYGLWNVLDDNRFEFTMVDRIAMRFLAYELCTCEISDVTFATDVWSFGMTAYVRGDFIYLQVIH